MVDSPQELQNEMAKTVENAIDATMEIALNKLLEYIEQDVYSYPDTWVNGWSGDDGRTGDFLDTWDRTNAIRKGNVVESEISQIRDLEWNPPFSHGSIVEGEAISLENLNYILNNGLRNTGIGFPEMKPRPFWDDFTNWCNANLTKIFVAECAKLGMNLSSSLFGFAVSP